MKNSMRRTFGILTQVGCTVLSLIAMYVCSFVVQIGSLYDEEMPRTLVLPVIMMLPALVIYLIWFSSKAKKFTDGTYIDLDAKNYGRVLFLFITFFTQYLLGFVVTLPLFGFMMEVSVPLLLSLAICEILLLIADILCFWVFCPISNDAY